MDKRLENAIDALLEYCKHKYSLGNVVWNYDTNNNRIQLTFVDRIHNTTRVKYYDTIRGAKTAETRFFTSLMTRKEEV